MRSKAWLAVRAMQASRSDTRAAAPVLLAHTDVTKNIKYFSMAPKLRHPAVVSLFVNSCNLCVLVCCFCHGSTSELCSVDVLVLMFMTALLARSASDRQMMPTLMKSDTE